MATEFTRHARDRMARDEVTEDDVERVLSEPESIDYDRRGNRMAVSAVDGRGIVVIVARGSNPRRVIAVWALGRRRLG